MKQNLIITLLLGITLISAKGGCADENNEQPVMGEWQWVKTFCCGRTSVWSSPISSNFSQSLAINEDGSFKLFKNDSIISTGRYTLRKGLNDYQNKEGDSALVIQFNDEYPAYVEFIGDTLLISRGYMDFDNVYYIRKSKID